MGEQQQSGHANRSVLLGLGAFALAVAGYLVWTAVNAASGPQPADAATRSGSDIQTALEAAAEYASQNEFEKARVILAEAIGAASEDQELRLAHAEALLSLGETGEAYGEYEAALAIGPRTAAIEFQAGTLANVIGRPGRAIEHYQAAQTKDPTDPQIPLFLGSVLRSEGRNDEAKAALLRAVALDVADPAAWASLAQVALDENNATLAIEHARKARAIAPDEIAWRLIEARALNRIGEPAQAALLLSSDGGVLMTADVLETLSRSYGMLGRPEAAAETYLAAAGQDPTNPLWKYQAALWLERAGDAEGALTQARHASMLGHEDAGAMVERLGG